MGGFLGPVLDTTRLCSRRVSSDPHRICGRPATAHIEWPADDVAPGGAEGWACVEHWREIRAAGWPMVDFHPVGEMCGMPGTLWSYADHCCIENPDIPVAEPMRAVAVPRDRVMVAAGREEETT